MVTNLANLKQQLSEKTREQLVDFLATPVDESENYPTQAIIEGNGEALATIMDRLRETGANLSRDCFHSLLSDAINVANKDGRILSILLENLDMLHPDIAFLIDRDHQNAFHHAAKRSSMASEMLKVFQAFGGREGTTEALKRRDRNNGYTPLHHAVKMAVIPGGDNNTCLVTKLVEMCPESVTLTDLKKCTPLHLLLDGTTRLDKQHMDAMNAVIGHKSVTMDHLQKCLPTMDAAGRTVMCLLSSISDLRVAFYGKDNGPELVFDMSSFSRQNFVHYLEDVENINIRFRSKMHSVIFPNLSCNPEAPCRLSNFSADEKEGSLVFRAMGKGMKQNGMESLRRLCIPDCPQHPHSDRIIRETISGLDLKALDWSKKDPSIRSLYEAAKDVEDLHLRSSGHPDIIAFWTGDSGLKSFKKLRRLEITLLRSHNLDDEKLGTTRTEVEGKLLQLRLHRDHCTDNLGEGCMCEHQFTDKSLIVHAQPEELETPRAASNANEERGVGQVHEFQSQDMEINNIKNICSEMETVLTFFRDLRDLGESQAAKDVTNEARWVKVAVIDSGMATCAPEIGKHVGGRSFLEFLQVDSPWFAPKHYHGTMVGSLIRKMNPYTKIYVANVHGGSSQRDLDKVGAISALKWAESHQVDIICTSWSIPQDNSDMCDTLASTLSEIHGKRILVFSAIDDDNPASKVLPAHHSTSISVRAATQNVNTNNGQANFAIPMEGIQVNLPAYLESERKRTTKSESSYATALGAGLASLLLLAVRYAFHNKGDADRKFQQLKGTDQMRSILRMFTVSGTLQPWVLAPNAETLQTLLVNHLGGS